MNLSFVLPSVREIQYPLINQFAIIVINFIVGLLLYTVISHTRLKDSKSRTFLLLGVSILSWVDGAYLARIFGLHHDLSLLFLRIAWIATPFVFYAVYLISLLLMKREGHHSKVRLLLGILTFVFAGLTAFTDLIIKDLKFTNGVVDIVYGVAFYPFLIAVVLIIIATLQPMYRTKINSSAKFFLIGVVIFYIMNAIFNITLPVFFGITYLYFLGDYSTSFLLAFTSYAIIRHKLFDIKLIASEALIITIWCVLFARIFLLNNTLTEVSIDTFVFSISVLMGIYLVRSVKGEITQREKLETVTKELSDTNTKLKSIDAKKNEFISMAAHELRAPLTAIRGFLSMVIDGDTGPITPKASEFLRDSMVSSERMIRLVNNMLDVGRIEEGRLTLSPSLFNISKVMKAVHGEFQGEALNKGLEFTCKIPEGVSDQVYVDEDKIHEVIVNLVSNAIKYTETGSVTIEVSNPNLETIRVEVKDTGAGISAEEQKKLFQKFYRVQSVVGKTIGTGLGLYISKLLIERFGGSIGLISESGKGSNFWFELPIDKRTSPHTN
jgi:signal transduction histidine kinase